MFNLYYSFADSQFSPWMTSLRTASTSTYVFWRWQYQYQLSVAWVGEAVMHMSTRCWEMGISCLNFGDV